MHVLFALAQEAHEAGADPTRVVLPEPDELIWGTIAFVVFLVVVGRMVFPRLRQALKTREDTIRGELERAERARVEAEEHGEQFRKQIADARGQADQIIRDATSTAEEVRRDLVAKAEEEARRIVEKARHDASQERDRVLGQMRREVADLALQAAARVVEGELANPDAQRRLVEQFIEQVGATGSGRG